MKITILSAGETGGAGSAAKNLQKGLMYLGANVSFLSEEKFMVLRANMFSKLKRWWLVRKNVLRNSKYLSNAPAGFDHFSFGRTGYQNLHKYSEVKTADVINIHWISYLLDYSTFFKKFDKPVIFTLHDTNLFTGGCHYTFECEYFKRDCANCPQLAENIRNYAAKDNLKLKQDSLKNLDINKVVIVSPSRWLMAMSQQSILFKNYKHFHVPYGIDTDVYKKLDKTQSRIKLGLPVDKFIILFVGTLLHEHRKGFDIILRLSDELKHRDDIQFVAIGKTNQSYAGILNLGYITDASFMAMAYSAASVFIIPSRQDNLPNTMLEALCCGTPVIGYKTGGIVDVIQHGENGFLVDLENVTDIEKYIMDMNNKIVVFNNDKISEDARQKYSLEKQALAYKEIINEAFAIS